jgi:hypothetical protein
MFHLFIHPVVQALAHLLMYDVPELFPPFVTKATTTKLLFSNLFLFLLSLCPIIGTNNSHSYWELYDCHY